MSGSLVSMPFFLNPVFAFVRCGRMLLSTGFLYALWMSCLDRELGAGWGSRGESMLLFIGRPRRPKRSRSHRNTVSSQRINMVIS
jgi:hypothetical protein